ncbi:PTS sugar transporter subunit IIC [Paenibacillus sp. S150]|uniref:PTS sugar transporter subunit IIC n=1 Tax=Paenibacillus sp. S150 TaxID=2749826 RepID=UPI001C57DEA2|nr:PTS transporter subunit EIIC [Paenibacillus sp. S150]MBW4079946.1 PTS sugar transporter subunit IIC [Paenibacillus sp. S150]
MGNSENFIKKLQKFSGKLQQNRYLSSISNGLMSTLPFLIIGAFSTLFSSLQWEAYQNLIAPVKDIIAAPATLTTNMISLYAVFFVAYRLAQSFNQDPLLPAATALLSFFILTPVATFDGVTALPFQWLGAQGLFVALIVGLVSARLYIWVVDQNWTIKMPDGVPPTVVKTFLGLIPAILVSLLFLVLANLFKLTAFETVHSLVYSYLQIPLESLGGSLGALILALLVMQILWMFGIHGAIVVMAILQPIWMSLDLANLQAYQNGDALPNIIGLAFWFVYANYAPMMGFAILLLIFAKSKQLRTIGKLGFPGTFFGIHEPLVFGVPFVLNPILAVPYVLSPIVCSVIGYVMTSWGIIPAPIGITPAFGTPVVAAGLMEGSWRIALMQILLVPVCMLIFLPFVKVLDKQAYSKELRAEKDLHITEAAPSV